MSEAPVFVTGASGFIGRHLVRALLEADREVIALRRTDTDAMTFAHPRLRFMTADLRALTARDLPEGATVFHLAALRTRSRVRASELLDVNVEATAAFARAAREAHVGRFVNVSSARIFGASGAEPVDERTPLAESTSEDAYVRSRVLAQKRLSALVEDGLPLVTLCPSVVYGPDEPTHPNQITDYIRRLLAGTRISPAIDGARTRRNLVYVADVVRALLRAERVAQAGAFAIIDGQDASQRDLEALVCSLLDRRVPWSLAVPGSAARWAAAVVDRATRRDATNGIAAAVRTLGREYRARSIEAGPLLGHVPTSLRDGLALTLADLLGDGTAERAAARAAERAAERRAQRKRWDAVASGLSDFRDAPSTQYYRNCEIALMQRAFGPLAGKHLLKLDLWNEAFNTRILHWARDQGALVAGIDASAEVVRRARRNTEAEGALDLVKGDIRHLPFADGAFDCVYTMGTIEHMVEYREAVAEIARVLRPGGRAVIGVPHLWDLGGRPLVVAALEVFDAYPYSPEKSFTGPELRTVIEAAGLLPLERTGILTLPGVLRMADLYLHTRGLPSRPLMSAMVAPFDWLETRYRWPGRFGYLLTYVAQKPG